MKREEYKKMFLLEDVHFWFVGKRYFTDSVLMKSSKDIQLILDLGSGTGGMTKYLEKYGKVTGIEQNRYSVKLAKSKNVNIKCGNINNVKIPKNKYDLVTIFDVLYHKNIYNEKKVLEKAKDALKNGGYILITDSAFNFLRSYHDVATQGNKRYTLEQIKMILQDSGFDIIFASYIFFSIFPLVLTARGIKNIIKRNVGSDVRELPKFINSFLIFILRLEASCLKYFSFPYGSSIIILAQIQK